VAWCDRSHDAIRITAAGRWQIFGSSPLANLQAAFNSRVIGAGCMARKGRQPGTLPKENSMIEHRPFGRLGGGNHGWLDTRHHFSFADYQDPARMHWGALRVWNDDTIQPGTGFPPHPHSAMEIIT
jgi:hypothetical protein